MDRMPHLIKKRHMSCSIFRGLSTPTLEFAKIHECPWCNILQIGDEVVRKFSHKVRVPTVKSSRVRIKSVTNRTKASTKVSQNIDVTGSNIHVYLPLSRSEVPRRPNIVGGDRDLVNSICAQCFLNCNHSLSCSRCAFPRIEELILSLYGCATVNKKSQKL